MKASPTSRTLVKLRSQGMVAAVTEHWNSHAGIRQDLYGFCDVLAHGPGGILAVQACAGASLAARRDKLLAEPRVRSWLQAGGLVEVWAWSKRGARGARKLWNVRIDRLRLQLGETAADERVVVDEHVNRPAVPLSAFGQLEMP